jgi:hypothetical protein
LHPDVLHALMHIRVTSAWQTTAKGLPNPNSISNAQPPKNALRCAVHAAARAEALCALRVWRVCGAWPRARCTRGRDAGWA